MLRLDIGECLPDSINRVNQEYAIEQAEILNAPNLCDILGRTQFPSVGLQLPYPTIVSSIQRIVQHHKCGVTGIQFGINSSKGKDYTTGPFLLSAAKSACIALCPPLLLATCSSLR